ncbi:MAG: lipopolysaccharide transport periplasmic protein LptA [Proteobacteria bacterium]|nr:lipopolysaccharide transport periplasmic protein LptA [Pseudomonadota bacterium]
MSSWFPGISIAIILSVLVGSPRPPAAEEEAKKGLGFDLRESSQPIRIKSDGLEWDYKGHVVTFKGNVIANQEDVTLYSDRMVAYYDETTNEVIQIVAEGAVRIVQLDRRATGEKAVFHNAEKKIVLTGRPVVRQGKNVVIGEKITILIDRDWVEVERADVTISPEEIKERSRPPSYKRGS